MGFNRGLAHTRLTQQLPQSSILILEPVHCTLICLNVWLNTKELALLQLLLQFSDILALASSTSPLIVAHSVQGVGLGGKQSFKSAMDHENLIDR